MCIAIGLTSCRKKGRSKMRRENNCRCRRNSSLDSSIIYKDCSSSFRSSRGNRKKSSESCNSCNVNMNCSSSNNKNGSHIFLKVIYL